MVLQTILDVREQARETHLDGTFLRARGMEPEDFRDAGGPAMLRLHDLLLTAEISWSAVGPPFGPAPEEDPRLREVLAHTADPGLNRFEGLLVALAALDEEWHPVVVAAESDPDLPRDGGLAALFVVASPCDPTPAVRAPSCAWQARR